EVDTADSTITGAALTASGPGGVDVLPLFERIAVAMENNDQAALADLLGEVDTAVKQVGLARTRTGGTMNILSSAISAHADLHEHLANEISRSVEADVIASASSLAKASTALEASKAVTAHIISIIKPS